MQPWGREGSEVASYCSCKLWVCGEAAALALLGSAHGQDEKQWHMREISIRY